MILSVYIIFCCGNSNKTSGENANYVIIYIIICAARQKFFFFFFFFAEKVQIRVPVWLCLFRLLADFGDLYTQQ